MLAAACGGETPSSEPPSASTPDPASDPTAAHAVPVAMTPIAPVLPPATPPPPSYEVHEWGVFTVMRDATELAAGPGRNVLGGGLGIRTTRSPGLGLTGMGIGKPVLYFHSDAPSEVPISARVSLTSFVAMEHWPPTTLTGHQIDWRFTLAECPPANTLDTQMRTLREGVCDTTDGYCEVADLFDYVAADARCLQVGETTAPFLFYRGGGESTAPTPITATRGRRSVTVNVRRRELVGATLFRVRVDRAGRATITEHTIPEAESFELDDGVRRSAEEAIASVRAGLVAQGLTADEAAAFLRAWQTEVFDPTASPSGRPVRDGLFALVTPADAEAAATLSFDPPPSRVVRVFGTHVELEVR